MKSLLPPHVNVRLSRVPDHAIDAAGAWPTLRYRGAAIPLRSLSTTLDAAPSGDEARAVVVETQRTPGSRWRSQRTSRLRLP